MIVVMMDDLVGNRVEIRTTVAQSTGEVTLAATSASRLAKRLQ